LGSTLRHAVNVLFAQVVGRPGAYATAAVNIVGSLAIGLLAGLFASGRMQHLANPIETSILRAFLFVGILGGFTTFSTLMLDTFTLAEGHQLSAAFLNVAVQVFFGYGAAYVGFRLAA
jgi:CrcB protein